jgi:hypothetical protein
MATTGFVSVGTNIIGILTATKTWRLAAANIADAVNSWKKFKSSPAQVTGIVVNYMDVGLTQNNYAFSPRVLSAEFMFARFHS